MVSIYTSNPLSVTIVFIEAYAKGKGDLAELAEWRKWRKHRKFCLGEQVQH